MGNFKFIGEMLFPKADASRPFIRVFTGGQDKKTPMASLNLGIKASDNNMVFVELFGSVQKTIKTKSADGDNIEIDWENRLDSDSVKLVANYKKYTIDLGDGFERQDFVSPYDAVLYLKENLGNYKGKLCVTGQWQKQWYKNKYYDKFQAQNFYAVDQETKNRLGVTVDVYYTKSSLDDADFNAEKRIYLDAYIKQYINKEEGSKYIPQRFVLDGTKIDFNNEKHLGLFNYRKKYMTTDKKTVVHMNWEVNYLNGADTVEFNESQLTKAQKEQVELGLATIDSFRPKGEVYGERVSEFRLSKPILTGDFADGLVDTELTVKEFDDEIHVPNASEEKLDDVLNKAEVKATKKQEQQVDEDDLFS